VFSGSTKPSNIARFVLGHIACNNSKVTICIPIMYLL
jgi:hypothetical protein